MLTNQILSDSLVAGRSPARLRGDTLAWRLLTWACVVPISCVLRRLLEAPERLVVSIPDDAFYYLTLAINFTDLGRWSFDHGVSVTNGFHPLYAYLLLPLAAIFGFSFSLVKAAILVNVIIFVSAIGWLAGQLRRSGRCSALLGGLACVVGCQIVAFNLTAAVEGAIALSIMLLLWSWLLLGVGGRRLGFTLGFLAPLARIELGATAIGIWAASIVFIWAQRSRAGQPSLPVARYATAAGGSFLGVLVVVAHNQWAAGTLLQGSGLVKLALAERLDVFRRLSVVGMMVAEAISPFSLGRSRGTSPVFKLVVLMATAICVLAVVRWLSRVVDARVRDQDSAQVHWPFALVASVGGVAAYLALYSQSTAHDVWYLVAFMPPIWLLVSFALRGVLDTPRLAGVASAALALFIGSHLWRAHTTELRPVQQDIYRGSLAMQQRLAPGDRVGSFNAGLAGFMFGGRVVNLDGLVNSDAASVVTKGHVDCYIRAVGLKYVFDLATTFERASLEGLGLTAVMAKGALVPDSIGPEVHRFDRLTLYRVDRALLERHCLSTHGQVD